MLVNEPIGEIDQKIFCEILTECCLIRQQHYEKHA
jgi:hypothetical protein